MSDPKKYAGLLTFLSEVKQNFVNKQRKLEELTMEDVRKMWEVKGANGDTIQMDLSWVASSEDISEIVRSIDDVVKSIDNIKDLIYETSYDVNDYAESCVSDWNSISRNSNTTTTADVQGYKGSQTVIVLPAKIVCGSYGKLNTNIKDTTIGTQGTTEKVIIVGNPIFSLLNKNIYGDEIIGIEKVFPNITESYQLSSSNIIKLHSSKMEVLDISKIGVNAAGLRSIGANPFFVTMSTLPELKKVILRADWEDQINTFINGTEDLMAQMVNKFPKFEGFIYK